MTSVFQGLSRVGENPGNQVESQFLTDESFDQNFHMTEANLVPDLISEITSFMAPN